MVLFPAGAPATSSGPPWRPASAPRSRGGRPRARRGADGAGRRHRAGWLRRWRRDRSSYRRLDPGRAGAAGHRAPAPGQRGTAERGGAGHRRRGDRLSPGARTHGRRARQRARRPGGGDHGGGLDRWSIRRWARAPRPPRRGRPGRGRRRGVADVPALAAAAPRLLIAVGAPALTPVGTPRGPAGVVLPHGRRAHPPHRRRHLAARPPKAACRARRRARRAHASHLRERGMNIVVCLHAPPPDPDGGNHPRPGRRVRARLRAHARSRGPGDGGRHRVTALLAGSPPRRDRCSARWPRAPTAR